MRRKTVRIAGIVVALACGGSRALAVPSYLVGFGARYASSEPGVKACILCHAPAGPPLNPYGRDFAAADHRFVAIEAMDSDRDGFTNRVEIESGTLPGDRRSRPRRTAGSHRPAAQRLHVAAHGEPAPPTSER